MTVLVLAIVVGCFAVLWPRVLYPILISAPPPPPLHLQGGPRLPPRGAPPPAAPRHAAPRPKGPCPRLHPAGRGWSQGWSSPRPAPPHGRGRAPAPSDRTAQRQQQHERHHASVHRRHHHLLPLHYHEGADEEALRGAVLPAGEGLPHGPRAEEVRVRRGVCGQRSPEPEGGRGQGLH